MNDFREKELKAYRDALCAAMEVLPEAKDRRLVFGDGRADASVVLVGEAPGAQEALLGKPFVGKAGKVLDAFLLHTGLDRSALYVTNTVKWRPTAVSKAGRTVNRTPNAQELALFIPWLHRELTLLQPKILVTLGNTPLRAVTGDKRAVIGDYHGRCYAQTVFGAQLFPIYHPAAVIYNRALAEIYQDDLKTLGALIAAERQ